MASTRKPQSAKDPERVPCSAWQDLEKPPAAGWWADRQICRCPPCYFFDLRRQIDQGLLPLPVSVTLSELINVGLMRLNFNHPNHKNTFTEQDKDYALSAYRNLRKRVDNQELPRQLLRILLDSSRRAVFKAPTTEYPEFDRKEFEFYLKRAMHPEVDADTPKGNLHGLSDDADELDSGDLSDRLQALDESSSHAATHQAGDDWFVIPILIQDLGSSYGRLQSPSMDHCLPNISRMISSEVHLQLRDINRTATPAGLNRAANKSGRARGRKRKARRQAEDLPERFGLQGSLNSSSNGMDQGSGIRAEAQKVVEEVRKAMEPYFSHRLSLSLDSVTITIGEEIGKKHERPRDTHQNDWATGSKKSLYSTANGSPKESKSPTLSKSARRRQRQRKKRQAEMERK